MKAVSLWSGGKDSCLACYKAQKLGHEVCGLINFIASDGKNSLSHGLAAELVLKQAQMTNIPVFQKAMPKEKYRDEFKAIIGEWKREKGIEGVIFGDIYLTEHKDWIDKVCAEIGVEPLILLWEQDTTALINEFIGLGFETIIVAVKSGILDGSYLGRKINREFVEEISGLGRDIDPCGENGEFHTFVIAGPLFGKKKIEILKTSQVEKDGRCFLNILDYEICNGKV
ncbi:MAG: diphthine--ammonia ligase [Candidatus Omnitrophica bacterium]|nr:diphthine--ammonia ligase [Candidatus Omnitrophota bacterium]MBU1924900.1 diphthine--ammonia ligase [Candidatus Omnitrophota bacterium]